MEQFEKQGKIILFTTRLKTSKGMEVNMKSEKGYTGVDIAISVIVLFIFISLIATLSYRVNSSSNEIALKSKATQIAIEEIETIKNKTWEDMTTEDIAYRDTQEVQQGYYRTIVVQDYHDIDPTKNPDVVKKVTVQIEYIFKGVRQKVELSTIKAKES